MTHTTVTRFFAVTLLIACTLCSTALAGQKASDAVDLNRASVEELKTLKGVGDVIAKRIVEYRENNGGFEKIEDIMKVKGIGEKTFLKLKDRLTVSAKSDS